MNIITDKYGSNKVSLSTILGFIVLLGLSYYLGNLNLIQILGGVIFIAYLLINRNNLSYEPTEKNKNIASIHLLTSSLLILIFLFIVYYIIWKFLA